jgi:hypothetical protein
VTIGRGAITSISQKHAINTQSSTEVEVVAADEVVGLMMRMKLFLEAQGYPVKCPGSGQVKCNVLEEKGQHSAGRRSRHLNIWLFFMQDQKEKGNQTIQYCQDEQQLHDKATAW